MGVFKTAVTAAFSAICIIGTANADLILSNTFSNQSLSEEGYKLAKAVFLPDAGDDFGWGDRQLNKDYNQGDNCKHYPLSSCPARGTCSPCPFNRSKQRLIKCDTNFQVSGNSCIPNSCQAINKNYQTSIPTNNICAKVVELGLTCYNNCRAVNCAGYNLDCNTVGSLANVNKYEECDDCKSKLSNCSPSKCRITECTNNMKVNINGTACILKDDTCPPNYFKSCNYGTTGNPEYTERGTACYQCQAKVLTCTERGLQDMDVCYINGGTNYGPLSAWTPANMGL